MAKKTKKVEEPFVTAVDLDVTAKMNVITNPSVDYSLCAFGSDFLNYKNYIEDDLEKMKKNFMPEIGSMVTDREGNTYRFTDIRKDTVKVGSTPAETREIDRYIFDVMIVQD